MGKIQSRHVSNKVCTLWIKYDEVLVKGWYKCSCCLSTLVSGMRELSRNSSVDWSIYLIDEPQLIDNDSDEENVTEEYFY